MLRALAEVDFSELLAGGGTACMITLTLPGDWLVVAPTAADYKRLYRNWRKRYHHKYGCVLSGFWKMEFQRASTTREPAPHLHIFSVLPPGVGVNDFARWVGVSWADVVAHPDPKERARHEMAGTQVKLLPHLNSPRMTAAYMQKRAVSHSSGVVESGKEYQHVVPPSWTASGGSGRFWGILNLTRRKSEHEVPEEFAVALGRLLRQASKAKNRRVRVVRPRSRLNAVTGELTEATPRRTSRRQVLLKNNRGFLILDEPQRFIVSAWAWWCGSIGSPGLPFPSDS